MSHARVIVLPSAKPVLEPHSLGAKNAAPRVAEGVLDLLDCAMGEGFGDIVATCKPAEVGFPARPDQRANGSNTLFDLRQRAAFMDGEVLGGMRRLCKLQQVSLHGLTWKHCGWLYRSFPARTPGD